MATKTDGSPLPQEYDGFGRCGIRAIKKNPKNDDEVIKKVNLYEKKRYTSKFDLMYYDNVIPKKVDPVKVNLLGPRKPSVVSPLTCTSNQNQIRKTPLNFILNNSSSTNLVDVSIDNMSSLNQGIINDLRQRHSVYSLGSHRLPDQEYQDIPTKDLIKIINQEDFDACPERTKVKSLKK